MGADVGALWRAPTAGDGTRPFPPNLMGCPGPYTGDPATRLPPTGTPGGKPGPLRVADTGIDAPTGSPALYHEESHKNKIAVALAWAPPTSAYLPDVAGILA